MTSYSTKLLNRTLFRAYITQNHTHNNSRRHASMSAWKIYDSLDNRSEVDIRSKLHLVDTTVPTMSTPADVLVKVHSTSINPLDVRMIYGYGRKVLDLMDIVTNFEPRITLDRYPLTLGRDFSGEVVATGPCATEYRPGDEVFGAIEPQRSGSHCEFITVPSYCLTKKPKNLQHSEAASIPFVGLTAYSALCNFGGLSRDTCNRKKVLILGGSGGVGSFSIQLLKLWGADVTATCSEEKREWLETTLFVDQAICYSDTLQMNSLIGRCDFVLDCGDYEDSLMGHSSVVENNLKFLKPFTQSVYVTLSPPILSNTDQHGIVLGAAQTAVDAVTDILTGLRSFNSARWAVFLPDKRALDYISGLFADEAIMPQVHSTFNFQDMPDAFEELESGEVRGKVVVDVVSNENKISSKSIRKKSETESEIGS